MWAFLATDFSQASYRKDLVTVSITRIDAEPPFGSKEAHVLDPKWINPSRANWLVQHTAFLRDLTIEKDGPFFKVGSVILVSEVKPRVKEKGPWFLVEGEFGCVPVQRVRGASTEKAARSAAFLAADLFTKGVYDRQVLLDQRLSLLRARDEKTLEILVNRVFRFWLNELERDWQKSAEKEAGTAEWTELTRGLDPCEEGRTPKVTEFELRKRIEAVLLSPSQATRSLDKKTRAPARRFNGNFTVRATVKVGETQFNGIFLVDLKAPNSLLSKEFMSRQGLSFSKADAFDFTRTLRAFEKEFRSQKTLVADELVLSGLSTKGVEFAVVPQTTLLREPEVLTQCCDGVLGSDFFKPYSVRFEGGRAPAVELYSGYDFEKGEMFWIPARFVNGVWVSECWIEDSKTKKRSQALLQWSSSIRPALTAKTTKLYCSAGAASGRDFIEVMSVSQSIKGVPLFEVGFEALDQDSRVYDFVGGKTGYRPSLIPAGAGQKDVVVFKFGFEKGNRVLRVKTLPKKDPLGAELLKAGLRVGQKVEGIGDRDALELDEWNVRQMLQSAQRNGLKLRVLELKGKKEKAREILIKSFRGV